VIAQHAMRWVIYGRHGLYEGQWQLKREAIQTHCMEKGKPWRECRKAGDRAVLARIEWTEPGALAGGQG